MDPVSGNVFLAIGVKLCRIEAATGVANCNWLSFPSGMAARRVAIDASGTNLYIANFGSNTVSKVTSAGVVSSCAAGMVANGAVSVCTACPAGAFCPEGSILPAVCPSRFYCPAVDSTLDALPRLCPVGAYCNQTGLAAATPCPVGYACFASSLRCLVC